MTHDIFYLFVLFIVDSPSLECELHELKIVSTLFTGLRTCQALRKGSLRGCGMKICGGDRLLLCLHPRLFPHRQHSDFSKNHTALQVLGWASLPQTPSPTPGLGSRSARSHGPLPLFCNCWVTGLSFSLTVSSARVGTYLPHSGDRKAQWL